MTNAPSDLSGFRTGTVIPLTGLTGDNVGTSPDAPHLASGGYHVGCLDIVSSGRWDVDYSTRQIRDRIMKSSNNASAMDIGDDWPHGGRAAWLRFNNLLVGQMQQADPALAPLRAVNFSPDGTATRRYDTNNRSQGVIASTDSVYMHTHLEWWRDTIGNRTACFARLRQIIIAAIQNTPLGDEMANAAEINASRNSFAATQLQSSYKVIAGDIDGGQEVTVQNPLQKELAAIKAAIGAPAPVDPAAVRAGIAEALADPAVVAALVKAINDDAARRAAE